MLLKVAGVLMAALLCSVALQAQNAEGGARTRSVSLHLKDVSVIDAVTALNRSENYSVVVDPEGIDLQKRISIDVDNAHVTTALEHIFEGQSVSYNIEGSRILVSATRKGASSAPTARQQGNGVRGTVLDGNGEPVIGAGVTVKGSRKGCVTDMDGKFSLENVEGSVTLEISCLGYVSETVQAKAGSVLSVVLKEDTTTLDEVVIVGFGVQKRENLTGAVATISSKDLNDRPVINAATALQGLDPSVNLTMGTGSPESTYKVDIRGAASINSASPLVLVDGIEMDLRAVNPNDIESISVLKDASASSIYGAKASAGVILVTTKSGASADGDLRAKISYSGKVGVAQNTTSTDFITCGYDFVTLENYFRQSYQGETDYFYNYTGDDLMKLLVRANDKTENPARPWVEADSKGNFKYYANFDWFGYLYNRTRLQHEHNLSVSGGNDKFNYRFSGRYLYQQGIFALGQSKYEDYAFRSKVGVRILPKLRYSNNISFDNSVMAYPGMPNYEATIAYLQNYLSPSFLPVNPDGTVVSRPVQLSSSQLGSGIAGQLSAQNTHNTKTVRTFTINNQLDWTIIPELKATVSYGIKFRNPVNRYRNNTYKYSRVIDEELDYAQVNLVENCYQENYYNLRQHDVSAFLTYKDSYGRNQDHNFTAVAGMQFMDYYYRTMQAKQYDLSNDLLSTFAVANGEIKLQQTINSLSTLGFFARLNYDWKGRYLLELSGRADGSSRFAPGSRWGFFPSASVGWRISEEPFFDGARDVMNNFKLRLSAGSLGNQQVSGYYTYIDQISTDKYLTSYTFDGKTQPNYASVTAPIASDLTWETVTTYNLGLDMGFFRGRLNFNADAYIRDTDNMLTSAMTLPDVYGASTPKTNYAAMRTLGYELYLSWNDSFRLAGKPFSYGVTFTLGDYVTKITKFKNDDKVLTDYYVGKTLGEIWGYHVSGLFQTDEEAAAYQASVNWADSDAIYTKIFTSKGTVPGQNLRAGDMRFEDTDGSGAINRGSNTLSDPGDRKVIGNTLPRYSYSARIDLSWYNFSISAFFQGVGRQNWYPNISSSSGQYASDFFGPYANPMTSFVHKDFEKLCWSEENTDGYFPRMRGYIARADGPLGQVNDYYLQNVAYIRLKNLSVGYTVPFRKNRYIDSIKLAFNGENLWYWSPLKKHCLTVDPELALTSSTNAANTGVGYFYSKVFTFSLDLTF